MIVSPKKAIEIAKSLKNKNQKIVLVGGCFDILHIGHIKFLKEAKKQGNFLLVLLESDENVTKLKGKGRPINSQADRALILDSLKFVDFVILLSEIISNKEYDDLIENIKPNVIAITEGSGQENYAKRQAEMINAKVISVIQNLQDVSTSRLAKIISEKFSE